jgi:hypothetical protein
MVMTRSSSDYRLTHEQEQIAIEKFISYLVSIVLSVFNSHGIVEQTANQRTAVSAVAVSGV